MIRRHGTPYLLPLNLIPIAIVTVLLWLKRKLRRAAQRIGACRGRWPSPRPAVGQAAHAVVCRV